MNDEKKTAIVCSNGGMRSAYGAGFLYTIATKFNITNPDIVIGSSGNAGNVMYFSSKQFENIKKAWLNHLATPKFTSYIRMPMMKIEYLVNTIFKEQNPLDIEALRNSSTKYYIPITDMERGKVEYVSNDSNLNPYDVLRAAKTMPIVCDGPVIINGRKYMDGGLGATLYQHTLFAKNKGATHILVIDNSNGMKLLVENVLYLFGKLRSPRLYSLFVKFFKNIKNEKFKNKLSEVKIIHAKPSRHVPAGLMTRNKDKLKETFERGEQDALSMERELRELFAK